MASQGIVAQRKAWLDEQGEEWVAQEILEAGTVIAFCRKHFDPHSDNPHARAGHYAFYQWVKDGGDERKEWFKRLKEFRSHHRAELATDRLDNSTLSNYKHQEAMAKQDRWLAAKLNRDEYGDGPQVQINNNTIDAGDIIAQALADIDSTKRILEAEVVHELPEPSDDG